MIIEEITEHSIGGINKPRAKVMEEQPCNHCKQPSGWTNRDLAAIPKVDKERKLKCQKCGKDFMTILPTSFASIVVEDNIPTKNLPIPSAV